MMLLAAQYLIVIGIAHVAFGMVRYRRTLVAALREGWAGCFSHSDKRLVAFWFIAAGPLISLIGALLRHAALTNDPVMAFPTGVVLAILAVVGIADFPKSPRWALLPPAIMLLLA